MGFIQGNFRPEMPPSRSAASTGCVEELTRSNSNTSSLTAEICKDVSHRPDDCAAWTDERHNLYLNHLELSFVKQLHQSKALLMQCSDQHQMDINLSKKRLIDVRISSEQLTVFQNGCLQRIDYEKAEPLSHTSADSHIAVKSQLVSRFRHRGMLFSKGRHGKGIIPHGLATCSHHLSANSTYYGDLTREGTDQNFSDDDSQIKSNFVSQTKRVKTAYVESSSKDQDQIVPSRNSPPTDHIN
ncbi:hypothetical protein ACJIZ3_015501 [Penstemon smallii]|uniref:Uncharacterized protein n=1 Tax=Penstemon smallii TaxID=265156 RepID=A0ABD3RMS8_9LAMI